MLRDKSPSKNISEKDYFAEIFRKLPQNVLFLRIWALAPNFSPHLCINSIVWAYHWKHLTPDKDVFQNDTQHNLRHAWRKNMKRQATFRNSANRILPVPQIPLPPHSDDQAFLLLCIMYGPLKCAHNLRNHIGNMVKWSLNQIQENSKVHINFCECVGCRHDFRKLARFRKFERIWRHPRLLGFLAPT